MGKKIFGTILVLAGGIPLLFSLARMSGIISRPQMPSGMNFPAGGPPPGMGAGPGAFGPIMTILPIVLVVVGIILITHKTKKTHTS